MFKELFTETKKINPKYLDPSMPNGVKNDEIYEKILKNIINISKNWVVNYGNGRIDVLPKNGKQTGPKLAKTLQKKLQKVLDNYGIKIETFDIDPSPDKELYGGLRMSVK